MADVFTTVVLVIFSFVTFLFLVSLVLKRNDIADVAWGTGIIIVGVTSFLVSEPAGLLSRLVLALALLWGVRLTVRIFLRNRKKGEDFRYKAWRETWGKWFYVRSYAQVYLLQGTLMIVVGYPLMHAAVFGADTPVSATTYLGILVWCVGYFFEVVGDYQLDRFIGNPANKGLVMDKGLWRYSRHPNYFGEVTMWWGIWLMVAVLPYGYVALVGPLAITTLILFVSGVPLLEKKFASDPAFQEYAKRTSVFFPLPPRPGV